MPTASLTLGWITCGRTKPDLVTSLSQDQHDTNGCKTAGGRVEATSGRTMTGAMMTAGAPAGMTKTIWRGSLKESGKARRAAGRPGTAGAALGAKRMSLRAHAIRPTEKLMVPDFDAEGSNEQEVGREARSYLQRIQAWLRCTKLPAGQRALALTRP